MMNIFAISGLLIFITCFLMAGFMFLTYNKSKKKEHLLWGIFCVSVAIWGGGGYKIATTADIYLAEAWWRITHIGVIFIPILFTHFVYSFLNIKRKRFIISLYLLGLFFLATNFIGNLFIANMRWAFNQFYYDSPPGIFYIPFTIMFVGLVIYSNIKLWIFYRKASGLPRAQIKYLLIALVVSFSGGSFSFLPVYKIDFYPVLNLLVCLAPIIIAYAITRYQLMDIRVAFRKIFIYIFTAVFSYGFFYFCVWLLTRLFGSVYATDSLILGIFIAIVFVALFFVIEKLVRFIANRYFFSALYSQHETLRHMSEKLTTIVDLEKLINNVSDVIKKTLGVDKIAFVLKNGGITSYKIHKNDGFKKTRLAALIKNKEIIAYFKKSAKPAQAGSPISSEELNELEADGLKEMMINLEARLLLPLLTRHNLQGLIVLGKKITSDAYSREDQELLKILANQTALAIENARLYDEMEEIISDQTKDIKGKNVKLKKLLALKTEFLHTASHQLRTPVSAIKGLVSMLRDGDFKNADEQTQQNAFNGIFTKTDNMAHILDDILIAEELDTEENYKLKNLERIDICAATGEIIKSLEQLAREKNVVLSIKYNGEKPHPAPLLKGEGTSGIFVLSEETALKHILRNLLHNAITYSERGGKVEVKIVSSIKYNVLSGGGASENAGKLSENATAENPMSAQAGKTRKQENKKTLSQMELDDEENLKSKACPERSRRIKNQKSVVVWSVKDSGIGISRASQKSLFEKFKRGKNANKMNTDGSGLGLFIVKKLVDAHSGAEAGFTSKEGDGSEFWVKFGAA